jgi:DNA-binding beta-propeller fold protein YncE
MRKVHTRLVATVIALSSGVFSAHALLQEKGGSDLSGPYEVVPNWSLQSVQSPGHMRGSQAGIFAESPNRILVVQRGELPIPAKLPPSFAGFWGTLNLPGGANAERPLMHNAITVIDGNGKVIEDWTQWDKLFEKGSGHPERPGRQHGPHSAAISPYDPERHVWIIDDKGQQVFKFTNDGKKLVMSIGVPMEPGNDDKHLGGSTDIAWLPDESFVLSDGYDNSRVVKFDKNGKYLMSWEGPVPPKMNVPHSIAADKRGRIYVADRGNNRIFVHDSNGKHLDTWPNIIGPAHIMMTDDQHLIVSTLSTNKFYKFDLNGKLLTSWGTTGTLPGTFEGIHGFHVDPDGNLWVAENFNGRVQKLRPKPGANKALLFGPPMPLTGKPRS